MANELATEFGDAAKEIADLPIAQRIKVLKAMKKMMPPEKKVEKKNEDNKGQQGTPPPPKVKEAAKTILELNGKANYDKYLLQLKSITKKTDSILKRPSS